MARHKHGTRSSCYPKIHPVSFFKERLSAKRVLIIPVLNGGFSHDRKSIFGGNTFCKPMFIVYK